MFEELNRIEKINIRNNAITKEKYRIPTIFLSCESNSMNDISESHKLRFRSIDPVLPNPELILSVKMLNYGHLIDKSLFTDAAALLRSYVILVKEYKGECVSFEHIHDLCNDLFQKISLSKT